MEDEFVDALVIETLRFWIKQIKHGGCTREQELAILDALGEHSSTKATIDDLASMYGVSKDAVNGVIKRKYVGKPKRNVVLYSFSQFSKLIPSSWRKKRDKPTS